MPEWPVIKRNAIGITLYLDGLQEQKLKAIVFVFSEADKFLN